MDPKNFSFHYNSNKNLFLFIANDRVRRPPTVMNPLLANNPDYFGISGSSHPFNSQISRSRNLIHQAFGVIGSGFDSLFNDHDIESFKIRASRTLPRWNEASFLFRVFGNNDVMYRFIPYFIASVSDYSKKICHEIDQLQAQKKEIEEEISQIQKEIDKREREKKEREEKERKEKEEAERKKKEEEEAAKKRAEEAEQTKTAPVEDIPDSESVEMVDQDEPSSSNAPAPTIPDEYNVRLNGHDVNISALGIDPTFLEAIPEDMLEEVVTQRFRELQELSGQGDEEAEASVSRFVSTLPAAVRADLLNEESDDRDDDDEGHTGPAELDNASFFASLDPDLRRDVLLEQDEETLLTLPPDLVAEARTVRHRNYTRPNVALSPNPFGADTISRVLNLPPSLLSYDNIMSVATNSSLPVLSPTTTKEPPKKKKVSAAYLHIIDKQGIAALLRTLYIPQPSPQESLLQLLYNLCTENKANRLDIINSLLHILADASVDKATLDRGFLHVSNRARYTVTPSKSQSLLDTPGPVTPGYNVLSQEVIPSIVAKQALEVLQFISHKSGPVKYFFVSEHDIPLTRKLSKKGKGKDKEVSKENKYPINLLISLLGKPSIYESGSTLEQLTAVLVEITKVVPVLLKSIHDDKKKKKLEDLDKENEESKDESKKEEDSNKETAESSDPATTSTEIDTKEDSSKAKSDTQTKPYTAPYIPDKKYMLISSTLVLKECNSRTFEQMLTVMRNLSAIEGVKHLFARELVSKAVSFGPRIIGNLEKLLKALKELKPDDELPVSVLAPFSSGSSDQARLLRALAALDYLYAPTKEKPYDDKKKSEEKTEEEDHLNKVYSDMNFGPLWSALSDVLSAIQDNASLGYVSTALLPLIESLMVVCKHSAVKQISLRENNSTGGAHPFVPSTKIDISKASLENLFFAFTDQHRKILNQLVRANPKLMNGSFSILVKNPKSLEFDNKRRYFTGKLYGNEMPHTAPLNVNVRREQTFLDSYRILYYKSPEEIKRSRLSIKFKGEEGIDAGGLTREWYQVMSRQMFNPDYALFQPVAADRTTFHPNRTSGVNEDHLSYFKFVGRIIGKAIYDNKLLDCHFSRAMYKKILGKPVSLKDMENLDLDYYKSLQWILENDITDIITETFSIDTDDYGERKVIDLKPDGHNIPVTEENKAEYVRLVCEYRLIESVRSQLEHFLEGFHEIIPKDLVSIFDEQELELLISGLPDIDIDDWRNNTQYQNYSPSSIQIKWFWRAVRAMDAEERAKLLQFVTGTSKVPLNGFKELVGMDGVSKFSIHRAYGSNDRLPSSHTCFNQIDLPAYDSYEMLREALLKAITEGGESFELA